MSYWGTKADELAVYALSDMLNIHSFVVTKHRPWTMVDASVKGTSHEMLHLCPVKLVFLGDDRYGRLWRKIQPAQHVSTYQTDLLPVFPDAQPLEIDFVPQTLTELETAETLLTMHTAQASEVDQSDQTTSIVALELQEPVVTPEGQITDFVIDMSKVSTEPQHSVNLLDAMDKVVNHEDVSFAEPPSWLKFRDCMDLITGRVSDLVETVNLTNLSVMDKIEITPCRVELVRIKFTPTVKLPTLQTNQDLIALGEYFTRSKLKPKKRRKNRRPHDASTNIDYYEDTPSSDADKKPKRKCINSKPPADGPSASRVCAQPASTGTPAVRLPPLETDKIIDSEEEIDAPVSVESFEVSRPEDEPSKGKGTFTT